MSVTGASCFRAAIFSRSNRLIVAAGSSVLQIRRAGRGSCRGVIGSDGKAGIRRSPEYHRPMLSTAIPLFPLPNVVLFPGVFLPLHIFEAHYRIMVRDVLAGDRMIGIALSQPGWHQAADAPPAIYPVGCVGLVTHVEQLDDGRYNIVLRGVERFRIVRREILIGSPGATYCKSSSEIPCDVCSKRL